MLDFHARHRIEEFAREVRASPRSGRAEGQLARIGLCVGDQFADGVHGQRRIDHQHDGKDRRHAHRLEIAADVVAEVVAQAGQHRMMDGGEEEAVAIGFGLGGELRAHDAARAGTVVHDRGDGPQLA
ncbi:hypothetical protein D9M68_671730 [compost metagenome]